MHTPAVGVSPLPAVERLKAMLTSGSFGPKALPLPELVSTIPWQSRLSEHFVLHYYDESHSADGLLDALVAAFEGIHADLVACMRIVPRTKPERMALETKLICFILRTSSPRTFGTIESPGILFYLLDPQQDPEYMQKLRHEIAHLVWGRSYGEAPPLFNEGVAVYAETASDPDRDGGQMPHVGRTAIDALPPLTDLAHTDCFWDHYRRGHPVYQVSAYWVRYLVERWGWEKLGALFLASEYEDPDIASHVRSIYGHDLDDLEGDWRRWLVSLEP
jgi:hypothetical protein